MFSKILFLNKIVMLYKKHVIAPTDKQTDKKFNKYRRTISVR